MVIDFKILKDYLKGALDLLDHKYLNEIPFFKERASSSEYLAVYIYNSLGALTQEGVVAVREVRVWESDTACASYRR